MTRLIEELEVSHATVKRDLKYLRESMNADIKHDVDAGGYRMTRAANGPSHELPGLWFNADEVHALLTMQKLLQELQPGLLTPHIKPLLTRLHRLLDKADASVSQVQQRVRVLQVNARSVRAKAFAPVSTAVLGRRQLTIEYFNRGRNTVESRTLSPQRLTYYRDNWYLDAWCHLRQAIRSFALDAIRHATVLDDDALDIAETDLDALFTPGYGIFSGVDVQWAVLRFSPERARWVSQECWHPKQTGEFEPDGYFILRVPYSDDRELVMDILRHMPEVTVQSPQALQRKVIEQLESGLAKMRNV